MKLPFSLVSKPKANVVGFAEGFTPGARGVWDTLTAEERIVCMADMAAGPNAPKLLDSDGKVRPLCRATMILVVENALLLTPSQYEAIAVRLRARFALAHEKAGGP